MKDNYNKTIRLRCIVCGSDDDFEFNDDKTYVKCTRCQKEYWGGYDELVELNKSLIESETQAMMDEVKADVQNEISNIFKKL